MGVGMTATSSMVVGRMPFISASKSPAVNCRINGSESSNGAKVVAVPPVYKATAPNRATRSPHSGSTLSVDSFQYIPASNSCIQNVPTGRSKTFDPKEIPSGGFLISLRRFKPAFFGGLVFQGFHSRGQGKLCLDVFCEDSGLSPAARVRLDSLLGGPRFPGVGAQIMGTNDEYIFQFDSDVKTFWGSLHELSLGHTFNPVSGKAPPACEVYPDIKLYKDTVRWEYSTRPIYGWGDIGDKQKAIAGWLAVFPVFEPHWQVCMAAGLSSGWIEWGDRRFEFENAPSYSEKNWGSSFPQKWFWVQCNVFEGVSGAVSLTAGGGKRGLPILGGSSEEVAMVGVHHAGKFYEFVPWTGSVEWEVSPWGSRQMFASNKYFKVKLDASADVPGVALRAPTADMGLDPFCKDTFEGKLRLQIWEISVSGRDSLILDATSNMAALEVGGAPWYTTWKHESQVADPLRTIVGLVEEVFGKAPQLKPPGL